MNLSALWFRAFVEEHVKTELPNVQLNSKSLGISQFPLTAFCSMIGWRKREEPVICLLNENRFGFCCEMVNIDRECTVFGRSGVI
jgi:hypothetical protein